jgi:hypothetical protein
MIGRDGPGDERRRTAVTRDALIEEYEAWATGALSEISDEAMRVGRALTRDEDVRPWPGMTTEPHRCPTCGEATQMRQDTGSPLCFYLCPQGHRHTLPDVLGAPASRGGG